jgi:hypothetical protein
MSQASKEADFAAIKANFECICDTVEGVPEIATDPQVVRALTAYKATFAAFVQAVADADAARQFTGLKVFRVFGADRHVRALCESVDAALARLRFAAIQAQDRAGLTEEDLAARFGLSKAVARGAA